MYASAIFGNRKVISSAHLNIYLILFIEHELEIILIEVEFKTD